MVSKCHKSGNRNRRARKKERYVNDFYAREKELHKLINDFVYNFKHLHHPLLISEYKIMDQKRLEIKRLLTLQSGELWKQSHRRKRFYRQQEDRFKYYYVGWKRTTYYIYLHVRFDVPLHLVPSLIHYRKTLHNTIHTIFNL